MSRMALPAYYRGALLLPLVLPALCVCLLLVTDGGNALPNVAMGVATFFGVGAIAYGVPYAILLAVLWRPSQKWSRDTFRRCLLWAPAGFATLVPLLLDAWDILHGRAASPDTVAVMGLGLINGYAQAALIAGGAWLGVRVGWLADPHFTPPPPIGAHVA